MKTMPMITVTIMTILIVKIATIIARRMVIGDNRWATRESRSLTPFNGNIKIN
jgi:hypothetical protein